MLLQVVSSSPRREFRDSIEGKKAAIIKRRESTETIYQKIENSGEHSRRGWRVSISSRKGIRLPNVVGLEMELRIITSN